MLTDFGRTAELSASATLHVDSQQQDVADRRANVLLRVDRAYFDVMRAQAESESLCRPWPPASWLSTR